MWTNHEYYTISECLVFSLYTKIGMDNVNTTNTMSYCTSTRINTSHEDYMLC